MKLIGASASTPVRDKVLERKVIDRSIHQQQTRIGRTGQVVKRDDGSDVTRQAYLARPAAPFQDGVVTAMTPTGDFPL